MHSEAAFTQITLPAHRPPAQPLPVTDRLVHLFCASLITGRCPLPAAHMDKICALIEEDPTLYLNEYVDWLAQMHDVIVSK